MISHKNRFIFIHIPKCAGSSIERFFGVAPFNWMVSNRLHLTGWDPHHQIHLQHATASELLNYQLVSEQTWDEYFKFAFVRNPYERAHSDYLWMMKDRSVIGSFEEYLTASGSFEKFLKDSKDKSTRREHLVPQYDYLYDENGQLLVDYIGRFETLDSDFMQICETLNVPYQPLPHMKKNTDKVHYREFYDEQSRRLVEEIYRKDLETFEYSYEG